VSFHGGKVRRKWAQRKQEKRGNILVLFALNIGQTKKLAYLYGMSYKKILFLGLLVCFIVIDAQAQGCSQCKMLAEQSAEAGEASFGSNINKGIMFLMVIPYVLLFLLFRKKLALLFKKKQA
jgi:hypothetical protein